jgi:peptidase S24-like protein
MPLMTEPCEDHKLNLAAEILDSGGTIRLQALGASMLPSIWPGDVLVVESKAGAEIVAGDIVLVARDGRFFVHRLVERVNSYWITRGDSMPQNDPPSAGPELLGRISAIHRGGRVVIPQPGVSLTVRMLAWMLCHADSLRNLTLRVHSFWRDRAPSSLSTGKAGLLIDGMTPASMGFRDE